MLWANWGDENIQEARLLSVGGKSNEVAEADSDKDGLRDWEEVLWGTDPENRDSDKDGTLDGQEVVVGRNPALAGPDDTLKSSPAQDPSVGKYSYSYDSSLGETLTDQVSRNLAANYLEAKSANEFDSATAEEIANRTLKEIGGAEIYRDIKLDSLKLVSNDVSTIESYGEKAIAILMIITNGRFAEAGIASLVIQGANQAYKLEPYAKRYADMRDLMIKMNVPRRFSAIHLTITQDLDTMARSLETLSKTESDPLAGMIELVRYGKAAEELGRAYESGLRLAGQSL